MRALLLLLFLYFFHYCPLQSQVYIESLKASFERQSADSSRLAACDELLQELINVDTSLARKYLDEGKALAEKVKSEEYQLIFRLYTGILLSKRQQHEPALNMIAAIQKDTKQNQLTEINARSLFFLGRIRLKQHLYQEALALFRKSVDEF